MRAPRAARATPGGMRWLLASLAGVALAGCGGSGGSGGGPVVVAGTNVAPILVDAGPAGTVNLPFVTVTVCTPGTTTCTTIDHVLLDTGSTGLRLVASELPAGFALPSATTGTGGLLYECMNFADGYSWGSVRSADVQLADGTAASLPIQLIGDGTVPAGFASAPPVPGDCPNGAPANLEDTVDALGANGILGLSVFKDDCGKACIDAAVPGTYYDCTATGCTGVAVLSPAQVYNPVYAMPANNNGVVVVLPAIGSAGQAAARGSLILGIGTQSNNALGGASVLTLDPQLGYLTTTYHGASLPNSFIDSGSNAYFFSDSSIAGCTTNAGFYCPAARLDLAATNTGANGTTAAVSFSVANADALAKNNPTFAVLPNVAGSNSLASSFDWGLPFFYGKSVYVGFEGRAAGAATGPYVAY